MSYFIHLRWMTLIAILRRRTKTQEILGFCTTETGGLWLSNSLVALQLWRKPGFEDAARRTHQKAPLRGKSPPTEVCGDLPTQ
jgi:hypothetical protein